MAPRLEAALASAMVAALMAVAPGCDPCPPPAALSGVVTDRSQAPLSGIVVRSCNSGHSRCETGRTNAQGMFSVPGVVFAANEGCAVALEVTCPDGVVQTLLDYDGQRVVCPCAAGLRDCGGCTDTQSDRANCGACGAACAAGQTCASGRCN